MHSVRKRLQDARGVTRYHVSAPVSFSWCDGDRLANGEGVTRDMSGSSMFVWSLEAPPLGSSLRCEVFLPRVGVSGLSLKVVIEGLVKRVDPTSLHHHVSGFAVVNQRVSIAASGEPLSDQVKGIGSLE